MDGLAVPRSAWRRAVGGGRERALEASSGPLARLAFFFGCTDGPFWRRGVAGETSGCGPARRSRGLGFEAESGMAGLGGSGWEEAVGEGRGRPGTSGRASEQAGGGHIDIDPPPPPPPRYEMAHWPAMAAV